MEGPVEGRTVVVNGAAGHLCVVDDVCGSWHISDLKDRERGQLREGRTMCTFFLISQWSVSSHF